MAAHAPIIHLSREESAELEAICSSSIHTESVKRRARIVLAACAGSSNAQIGRAMGVSRQTVSHWRQHFSSQKGDRVACLFPAKRQNPKQEAVVNKALFEFPKTAWSWSTRVMAREANVSRSSVQRAWSKRGIRPAHFGINSSPLLLPDDLAERITDVVGLFFYLHFRAVVVRADTRKRYAASNDGQNDCSSTLIQRAALFREALIAMEDSLVGASDLTLNQFIDFLNNSLAEHPAAELHVLTYSWHAGAESFPEVQDYLARNPRLKLHPTPKLTGIRLWVTWVNHWLCDAAERATNSQAFVNAEFLARYLLQRIPADRTLGPTVLICRR